MPSCARLRIPTLWMATALLIAAGSAQAGTLPYTGTLTIDLGSPIMISGSGIAIADGSGDGSHVHSLALAASAFAISGFVLPITDPASFPIAGMKFTAHNGAGNFADGGGTLGGVMPVNGIAKVCLFAPCVGAPTANLTVPLTPIGAGGAAAVSAAVNLTVYGAPWTTGTAAVGTVTVMGSAYGPGSSASSTFAPGGHIQFVTPIYVSSNIGAGPLLPWFATLTINFVPEPATLLLLGGGIAALGYAGRSRRG
jgi:hypothetical protein